MSIRMRADEDHEGSEFCADYQDRFGKWNQGFHCPSQEGSLDVYCCGSDTYKYCCTKRETMQPSEIPEFAILLGILLGAIFAIALITILSCSFCSCCLLYKRRHATVNGGPLYQMHCSSTASGVANMYSFSNQNSSATTPIDTNGPNTLVDLDYHQSVTNGGNESMMTPPQSFATVDLIPANAKSGNYGLGSDEEAEEEKEESKRQRSDKREVHFEDARHDNDDAPPPYEETNPVIPPVVVSEEQQRQQQIHLTSTLPKDDPEGQQQQGASQNIHLTTGSPTSAGKSTHSSHTSVNSNQATPSSEETLYWSTKF